MILYIFSFYRTICNGNLNHIYIYIYIYIEQKSKKQMPVGLTIKNEECQLEMKPVNRGMTLPAE